MSLETEASQVGENESFSRHGSMAAQPENMI
jgi:hypothetical protein